MYIIRLTTMRNYVFFISALIYSLVSFGQNEVPVEYSSFSAVASHGKVLLNWSIEAGSTCNGTDILRSTDNVNFKEIGNIVGICGDPSFRSNYSFIDNSPEKNKTNYYKLRFPPSEFTFSIAVDVLDFGSDRYIIRTNPVQQIEKLYFRDTGGDEAELTLIDMKGIHSKKYTTTLNYFLVDPGFLENGLYYFSITSGLHDPILGKFIIVQ